MTVITENPTPEELEVYQAVCDKQSAEMLAVIEKLLGDDDVVRRVDDAIAEINVVLGDSKLKVVVCLVIIASLISKARASMEKPPELMALFDTLFELSQLYIETREDNEQRMQ